MALGAGREAKNIVKLKKKKTTAMQVLPFKGFGVTPPSTTYQRFSKLPPGQFLFLAPHLGYRLLGRRYRSSAFLTPEKRFFSPRKRRRGPGRAQPPPPRPGRPRCRRRPRRSARGSAGTALPAPRPERLCRAASPLTPPFFIFALL